jgi:hypothetical protein
MQDSFPAEYNELTFIIAHDLLLHYNAVFLFIDLWFLLLQLKTKRYYRRYAVLLPAWGFEKV